MYQIAIALNSMKITLNIDVVIREREAIALNKLVLLCSLTCSKNNFYYIKHKTPQGKPRIYSYRKDKWIKYNTINYFGERWKSDWWKIKSIISIIFSGYFNYSCTLLFLKYFATTSEVIGKYWNTEMDVPIKYVFMFILALCKSAMTIFSGRMNSCS